MKYYGRVVDNPKAPDYGRILDVGRWYEDDDGEVNLERWDGEKWVDWPGLLAASGMGGSNPFILMTERDARKHIAGAASA